MEMQDIFQEERSEGAGEPMLQVQTEEETDHYAQLQSPSEDVYIETFGRSSDKNKTEKKSGGNTPLYPAVCLFLGLICLILLVIVIILGVKLQTESTTCQGHEKTTAADMSRDPLAPACSFDKCEAFFNTLQPQHCQCQECATGWTSFGRSCLYFSTTRLSWGDSMLNCTGRGGSLAIVNSSALQSFLVKKGSLTYWIGLKQTGGAWKWVNKHVLEESHWAELPMDGDCAVLNARNPPEKNWIRAPCSSSAYYVCQINF